MNVGYRFNGFTSSKICTCLCVLLVVLLSFSVCFADDLGTSEDEKEKVLVNEEVTSLRISSSDTSGLHAIMLSLIGDYNPIVKDYTYSSSQGYTSHSIDIQPDWSWIATCAVFIVVLYSALRMIGIALGGIKQ